MWNKCNIKAQQNQATKDTSQWRLTKGLSDQPDNVDVQAHWEELKTTVHKACAESIGYCTRRHQDWFDENNDEILALIHQKKKTFCIWQN